MTEHPEMMKCDWCGKEFPADARACVEIGIDAIEQPMEGEDWKGPEVVVLGSLPADVRERTKADLGIGDADLDRLLTTGSVEGLGGIVCLECQDQAAEDQATEEP